jgi:alkaline phosphatase D
LFTVSTGQAYPDQDATGGGYKIYPQMLKLDPSFFVHTGDILYYDRLAKTYDLALWHWTRMYSLPTNVAFHRQVASYFIKDDHDTHMNDCWPGQQTKFMGEFTFEQGLKIFPMQVPMGEKTNRTFRWGKDLQVWLVEGRDFRSPNTMPDGPEKTIWGNEQKEWFKRTVQESDATFRLLISPTPIVGPDRENKHDNHSNKDFKTEGDEIRQFLARQKNMFVICGDRHWQYVSVNLETGVKEFSCGPASNEHAGGWRNDMLRPEHKYLNITGGFLAVKIDREKDKPTASFIHYSVDGELLQKILKMNRRKFLQKTTLGTTALILNKTCSFNRREKRPNVLFIAVDDLRPELNCFGRTHIISPNLDKLANEGIIFINYYVQAPTCGASRASMLTGKYPNFSIPQTLSNTAPELIPNSSTSVSASLPHHFRRNGYQTVCIGKISHDPESVDLKDESGSSIHWNTAYGVSAQWGSAWNAFFAYAGGKTRIPGKTPAWENADVADEGYPDGLTAQEAIKNLQELKKSEKPFFLGIGFYKPHLPFNAPKKYWDLYDHNKIKLAEYDKPPENINNSLSLHKSSELTPRYTGLATPGKVTAEEAKNLRHAYFSCVSYTDAQIGKILNGLDRLGLRDNTMVVVWGDHGWH